MEIFSGHLTACRRCPTRDRCVTFCGATLTIEEVGESLPGVPDTLSGRSGPSPAGNLLVTLTLLSPGHIRNLQPLKRTHFGHKVLIKLVATLTLKLGSNLLVQGASTGDGGVQLVPWQKCGHHLLCSQLLLPMWKSGNLMIMGGSNLYCVLCRLPSWSSTTPWSIPSSSLIRPPGAFSPSFIIYKKVSYRCFFFVQEGGTTCDSPHSRLLPLNSTWLLSHISTLTHTTQGSCDNLRMCSSLDISSQGTLWPNAAWS